MKKNLVSTCVLKATSKIPNLTFEKSVHHYNSSFVTVFQIHDIFFNKCVKKIWFIFQVVSNAVRQLQHLVMDEACVDCHELFQTEKKNGATGGYCRTTNDRHIAELLYQKRAEKLLADENCFKLFIYHQSGKMSFELLDTESEAHNSDQVCSI